MKSVSSAWIGVFMIAALWYSDVVNAQPASSVNAKTCSEYNALGQEVNNVEELGQHQLSKEQVNLIRENTALKAGRVAALQVTPMAQKLSRILKDQSLTAQLASTTSALVRRECFNNPEMDFYETVSAQFEAVVNHLSDR